MELKAGYKQTEVGVIPEDWEVREIGYFEPFITSGSRGWAKYYSENGFLFIRITNMIRHSINLELKNSRFVCLPEKENEGKRTYLKNADILISITADIGIISYIDNSIPTPAFINQHIALVRFEDEKINSLFVSYFLVSENAQKHFISLTDSGAKAGMSLVRLSKVNIVVPSPQEQAAIATALSDVDALISALDKLITKKRLIKQGAIQELLSGKKRLAGFSGEWEVKKLGDIGEIITGSTPSTQIKEYWNGSVPWITPTDISNNKNIYNSEREISNLGLKSIRKLPANSLLVTCIASIGKNAILRVNGACNQQINAIIPNDNNDVDFLYYLIENNKQYLLGNAGITATLIISKKDFSEILFSFPRKKEEQTAIAKILSDMDSDILALETQRNKTLAIKQGMMQNLLTGKIRLI